MEPYDINGVVHVGASRGEFAEFYHKLGVNKVLWIEKSENKYGELYTNTCKFGMDQRILTAEVSSKDEYPSGSKRFLTLWRENASFIDIDTYDVLHVACAQNRIEILEGFEFILDGFKEIVFTGGEGYDLETLKEWLGYKKFFSHSFIITDNSSDEAANEFLFVKER